MDESPYEQRNLDTIAQELTMIAERNYRREVMMGEIIATLSLQRNRDLFVDKIPEFDKIVSQWLRKWSELP